MTQHKRLADIDPEVVRAAIEILSERCKAPIIDPAALATEQGRLELAYRAGSYRVVQDLIASLKSTQK